MAILRHTEWVIAVAAVFAAMGCRTPAPEGRFTCTMTAECPPEMVCAADRLCRRSGVDASTDAPPADAPGLDAAANDGGIDDAGIDDASIDAQLEDASRDSGVDAGPPRDCGRADTRPRTTVVGAIGTDMVWTCDNVYVLTGVVRVRAVLEIESGTRVIGEGDAALVIDPAGRLLASGTADRPIVFGPESAAALTPGGWGGIALLGSAPVNGTAPTVGAIPSSPFGGVDATHDCGVLRYVRIDYPGDTLPTATGYVSGLTLAGCGSATVVSNVHVDGAQGEGVLVLGGTVALDHLIVTGAENPALAWDRGWTGRLQFFVAQPAISSSTVTLQGSNNDTDHAALPRSHPTIYNATLLGAGTSAPAVIVRRGSYMELRSAIIADYGGFAIDARDAATYAGIAARELALENSIFYLVGTGGVTWTDPSDVMDGRVLGMIRDADPGLVQRSSPLDPVPSSSAAPANVGPPPPDPFDNTATFTGAIGFGNDWTAWTALP